jgi:hypothetical protein
VGENRRTRREKVRKEGSEAWRGRRAVRARLVLIPLDSGLIFSFASSVLVPGHEQLLL